MILHAFDTAILAYPLFYESVLQLVTIMQAYFIEWDINLVPANVRFNNLKTMSKLS